MGENICTYASDNGSNMQNIRKSKNPIAKGKSQLKRIKDLNRHFSKEDMQMANSYTKVEARARSTHVRMPMIKRWNITGIEK